MESFYYSKNHYVINLTNVSVDSDNSKIKVRLILPMDTDISEELSLGDSLAVSTTLNRIPLVSKSEINFASYNNTVYSGYSQGDDLIIENREPNLLQKFKVSLKESLNRGLTNENADIAYSVIVGDKSELDMELTNTFSFAGISHILAVSGLHVGFLVAVITFLLNLCRVGRRNRFFITSAILILYCLLCGFTASVLRASFMIFVLLLAGVLGEEYDGINALGFAGIMILLIFPLQIFSVGFQLSFMCVFMIMTLADKLSRFLVDHHINSAIASAISISLCVTLGSAIILASTLHEISLISIVANLFVIPMFSFAYPLLFVFGVVGVVLPFVSFLLAIPGIVLHAIKFLADYFASLNFAHFRIFNLGALVLFSFILLAIFIKYFMVDKRVKIPVCIVLSLVCVVSAICGAAQKSYNQFALHTNYQYNTNSGLITTDDGKKILVGLDKYGGLEFLTDLKICSLDLWIMPEFEVNKEGEYLEFLDDIDVGKLIIPTNIKYTDRISEKLSNYTEVICVDSYSAGVDFSFIKTDKDVVCGTLIKVNQNTLLFTNGVTKEKLYNIGKNLKDDVDYIITNKSKYDFYEYGIVYDKIIHSNNLNFSTNRAISLKNTSHYVVSL